MATLARMQVDLIAKADQFNSVMDSAAAKMQSVGDRLTATGKQLSTRVTLPLAAVGGAAVKMAADAEEAANKFNVVMGGSANEVRAELMRLTETIPLTQSQLEQMSAGIQDMLVPMGLARDRAAGMSVDMVKLAGDLASFNNVPTTQVLEAMQSALAGASEPMRRFGVDTRKTRLKTLALKEGLIEQGQELNTTAQAQATLLAIQSDSSDAMGDAARTADDFTNSVRFLWADVKELGIAIGQILIPVLEPMIQKAIALVNHFRELSPQMKIAITAAGALAAALGPMAVAAGTVVKSFGVLIAAAGKVITVVKGINPTVALAVAAFASVMAASRQVIKHWDVLAFETKRAMKFVIGVIRKVFVKPFAAFVEKIVLPVVNTIIEGFNRLAGLVGKKAVPKLEADVVESFDNMVDGMGRAAEIGAFEVSSRFQHLKDGVTGIVNKTKDNVGRAMEEMSGTAQAHTQDMVQKINDMAREMEVEMVGKARAMGQDTGTEFADMKVTAQHETENMRDSVAGTMGGLADDLVSQTRSLMNTLGIEWEGLRKVETIFNSVMQAVQTDWGSMFETLTQDLPTFISKMVSAFKEIAGAVTDAFGFVRDFFSRTGGGISGPGGAVGGSFTVNLPDLTFLETAFAFQDRILRDIEGAIIDQRDPLVGIEQHTRATAGGVAELVQGLFQPSGQGRSRSAVGSDGSDAAANRTVMFHGDIHIGAGVDRAAGREAADSFIRRVDEQLGSKTSREERLAGEGRVS